MKTEGILKMIPIICLAGLMVLPVFGRNNSTSKSKTLFGMAGAIEKEPDLYWLSYVENAKGIFLMQIDSTGKVTRVPQSTGDFGPLMSPDGADKINLWGYKERVAIDRKTLTIVKKMKTNIGPDSVTNKTQKNFLTTRVPDPLSLKFFGVSPTGLLNGATWIISTEDTRTCDSISDLCPFGTVSSDGKAIFWVAPEFDFIEGSSLYIQPLLDTGRPDGSERLVGQDDDVDRGGIGISNVLSGGKTYLVYLLSANVGLPRQLILQAVDAQTGQRIGDKILLKKAQFGYSPFAIDPLGRFVVYSYQNEQKIHFLSFQALDETGHPSGISKVLMRKLDAYAIHVLKD